MTHLVQSERVALWVFGILLLTEAMFYPLYRVFWALAWIPMLFWIVAILLAVFHIGFAVRDRHVSLRHRLRAALAIPIAIAAVIAVQIVFTPGTRAAASIYLAAHSEEMAEPQRAAGAGRPAAIAFIEGVPDGGLAIVRSGRFPDALPPAEQLRLTNEEIERCETIVGNAWVCWFD